MVLCKNTLELHEQKAMKYNKCKGCEYKGRPQISFPCSRCEKDKQHPLTCKDCRQECYRDKKRKSLITCKDFEWG